MAALTEDAHVGQVYEVTGPRLLTFEDVAAELTRATGRPVRYLQVSAEDYAAAPIQAGVVPEEVEPLTHLFTQVLDGRNAHLADGIRRALGREPKDFADYARDAAATGVWDVATDI